MVMIPACSKCGLPLQNQDNDLGSCPRCGNDLFAQRQKIEQGKEEDK